MSSRAPQHVVVLTDELSAEREVGLFDGRNSATTVWDHGSINVALDVSKCVVVRQLSLDMRRTSFV
jgi:hypothetical protein